MTYKGGVKMRMSQTVKDLKSAEEFCKANKIKPLEIIIIWDDDYKKK